MTPIAMPKLSDTMLEGTLIKWHKKPGDKISIGDVIAEVETDKATMEMEAFDEGVIAEIVVKEGGVVKVGEPIAMLEGGTAAPKKAAPAPAAAAPAPKAPVAPVPGVPSTPKPRPAAIPLARAMTFLTEPPISAPTTSVVQ